uniref:Uncharacterized protein n=1 Tax=mine drainage metagenome TaxID=410659 RepID=E6QME6_9ZZZZ
MRLRARMPFPKSTTLDSGCLTFINVSWQPFILEMEAASYKFCWSEQMDRFFGKLRS